MQEIATAIAFELVYILDETRQHTLQIQAAQCNLLKDMLLQPAKSTIMLA